MDEEKGRYRFTYVKNLVWEVNFTPEMTQEYEKRLDNARKSAIEENEDISDVFDEKSVRSDIIELYLGLPQETVLRFDKDFTPSAEDIEKALHAKYGQYDFGKEYLYDEARSWEIAKQRLKDSVQEIIESDDFKKYLDLTENFKNFSVNNKLLVYAQKPDATMVKTATQWRKEYERFPAHKPTWIWIYCPKTKNFESKDVEQFIDWYGIQKSNGNPYLISLAEYKNALDRLKNDQSVTVVTGMTCIRELDVSDTYGKELPLYKKEVITNEEAEGIIRKLSDTCGVPYANAEGTVRNVVDSLLHGDDIKVPTISSDMSLSETAKTFETSAITYLVLKELGIESKTSTLSGIAEVFADNPIGLREQIFKNLYGRIDKTARYISKGIDRIKNEMVKNMEVEEDMER